MERVKAARGERLRCQGWRQEAILRLLENNLENGENPEELIIYKATAKAARDWTSYERIRLMAPEGIVCHNCFV